ncbi:methionyl-tRNA formyltransferase [Aminipila terrae]|uniref:methionyl-tRNA formyltransferase n=1 Tax=Aminipila terrae TaxID=2697030 RepID=UPI001FAB5F70|nr:methionyl-tRNA formyltransferase [Aminipila terrae]
MKNKLKTIYMGTPEFAVPGLEALYNSGHEIGYVVTQPDKARDRGKKVQFTAVKEKAVQLGLSVLQPEKIKGNEEFFKILKAYNPDLIVVAAYGKLLPPEIIHLPRLGCVNIHASLLPRWRGAAPMQRAIMAGDEYTGVTLMYMAEGLDTGDMIAKKTTPILRKTAAELHDEIAELGEVCFPNSFQIWSQGILSEKNKRIAYLLMLQ